MPPAPITPSVRPSIPRAEPREDGSREDGSRPVPGAGRLPRCRHVEHHVGQLLRQPGGHQHFHHDRNHRHHQIRRAGEDRAVIEQRLRFHEEIDQQPQKRQHRPASLCQCRGRPLPGAPGLHAAVLLNLILCPNSKAMRRGSKTGSTGNVPYRSGSRQRANQSRPRRPQTIWRSIWRSSAPGSPGSARRCIWPALPLPKARSFTGHSRAILSGGLLWQGTRWRIALAGGVRVLVDQVVLATNKRSAICAALCRCRPAGPPIHMTRAGGDDQGPFLAPALPRRRGLFRVLLQWPGAGPWAR